METEKVHSFVIYQAASNTIAAGFFRTLAVMFFGKEKKLESLSIVAIVKEYKGNYYMENFWEKEASIDEN